MSYSLEVLTDAPLIFWKLDETSGTTVTDSSGHGRNGVTPATNWNGPAIYPGLLRSLKFDATSNVNRAVDSTMNVGTGDFTYEFLIKGTNVLNYRSICGKSDSGGAHVHGVITTITTGTVRGYTGSNRVIGTINVLDGNPHHVVYCRRSGTLFLYIDGVADGSLASSEDTDAGTLMYIDTVGQSGDFNPPTGDISHFAYYNIGLSVARVTAHYAALVSGDIGWGIPILV